MGPSDLNSHGHLCVVASGSFFSDLSCPGAFSPLARDRRARAFFW